MDVMPTLVEFLTAWFKNHPFDRIICLQSVTADEVDDEYQRIYEAENTSRDDLL